MLKIVNQTREKSYRKCFNNFATDCKRTENCLQSRTNTKIFYFRNSTISLPILALVEFLNFKNGKFFSFFLIFVKP